jgi:hypothetical protein
VFHKIFSENMTALRGFLQAALDLPAEEYQRLEADQPGYYHLYCRPYLNQGK